MAEHVAGTAMVMMRVLAAAISNAPGTLVILAYRCDVITVLSLP